MVTKNWTTTLTYQAEGILDNATRTESSDKATVVIYSGKSGPRGTTTLAVVGGRARFKALFDLLDNLLADWKE